MVPFARASGTTSQIDRPGAATGTGAWRSWHLDLLAVLLTAAGLALRLAAAWGWHLSGDEALAFQLANHRHLIEVYRESLGNAHPPLFFFLLDFWRFLGNSEFHLRLLPAIAGACFLWVAYLWASRLLGGAASLAALVLLAFSPGLIALSAEVRGYTLLLLFLAAALLFFEKATDARSVAAAAISSAFLCLAILTHYSAILVLPAFGVYALVRLREPGETDFPPASPRPGPARCLRSPPFWHLWA